MKKITIISCLFLLASVHSYAQKGILSASLGVNTTIPIYTHMNYEKGSALKLSYGIAKKSNLTFSYSSIRQPFYKLNHTFINIGYQQYLTKKRNFYAIGEVGVLQTRYSISPAISFGIGGEIHLSKRISLYGETKSTFTYKSSYGGIWWTANAGIRVKLGSLK